MGGDRACPSDCPVAMWESLSPTDRKKQRQAIAKAMHKRGMTPERIAKEQDVGLATTYRDLDVSHDEKRQGVDTRGRKKGGGRPKGSTKPKPEHHAKVIGLHDQGVPVKKIAAEVGVGERMVDRVLEVERARREGAAAVPPVERANLSMTAQEKLDAAIRHHKRKLDDAFEGRVLAECQRRLNEISLPHYYKKLTELERAISNRKGIMDHLTYRKILSCLHPDRVQDPILKKRFEEAFRLFSELEKRVLDEKQSPTEFRRMPRTYEELMAMKAKVKAERRAKRSVPA